MDTGCFNHPVQPGPRGVSGRSSGLFSTQETQLMLFSFWKSDCSATEPLEVQ